MKKIAKFITAERMLAFLCCTSLVAYFASSRAVEDMLQLALKIASKI